MYVDQFETSALFITPTIDNMLAEKLFFYSKYFIVKQQLERNLPIEDEKYSSLKLDECKYLLFKFYRAILKLLEAVIKRDNNAISADKLKIFGKSLIKRIIDEFNLYKSEDIETIVNSIYPNETNVVTRTRKPLKISATPSNVI